MGKALLGFTYLYMFILWALSGLIHIWTIYIAYDHSGWFLALVTMLFPLISQIVWGYIAWSHSGFESPYIQWLLLVVGLWIINYIIVFIISIFSKE